MCVGKRVASDVVIDTVVILNAVVAVVVVVVVVAVPFVIINANCLLNVDH